MDLFGQSITILEKSLDVRMTSQRVVSANLANIDTPGYKAERVDFEGTMKRILADPQDPKSAVPEIDVSQEAGRTLDGNNVDIETELSELSRNKLMFSLTSQLIAAKFRQLASVVDSNAS